jgi:hypothetical protein
VCDALVVSTPPLDRALVAAFAALDGRISEWGSLELERAVGLVELGFGYQGLARRMNVRAPSVSVAEDLDALGFVSRGPRGGVPTRDGIEVVERLRAAEREAREMRRGRARPAWLPAWCHLWIGGHLWGGSALFLDHEDTWWFGTTTAGTVSWEVLDVEEPEWVAFVESVGGLDAWRWSGVYSGGGRDGTQWSFALEDDGRRLDAEGSNAYPPSGARARGPEFDGFLAAVERLLDGRRFREPRRGAPSWD